MTDAIGEDCFTSLSESCTELDLMSGSLFSHTCQTPTPTRVPPRRANRANKVWTISPEIFSGGNNIIEDPSFTVPIMSVSKNTPSSQPSMDRTSLRSATPAPPAPTVTPSIDQKVANSPAMSRHTPSYKQGATCISPAPHHPQLHSPPQQ